MKSILLLIAGGALVAAPLAFSRHAPQRTATPDQSQTPAPVSSQATAGGAVKLDSMKNPVKPTAESQAKAKQLYAIDCALCHGDNGNGKTDVATSMGLTLSDFSDPKTFQNRMDGELFNLIRNGKDKMPAEEAGRAKDDEVWNLIIYIRKFASAAPAPAPAPAPAQ